MSEHSPSSQFDCVGIGLSTYDFTLEVSEYPIANTKNTAVRHHGNGGGPVPTAIVTLASLGCKTALASTMGDDLFCGNIMEELHGYNIDTSAIRIDPDIETLQSHILVESGTGNRTVIMHTNQMPEITREQVPEELLRNTRFIALDSRPSPTIIKLVQLAKKYGTEIMLDAGSVQEHTDNLLPLIDYPVVSRDFVTAYFGHSNYESACRELVKRGARIAGVTMGKDGSVLADGKQTIYIPAFKVDTFDSTGAGDVYHGGFLFGIMQKWPLKAIGQFASAVAAITIEVFGSRTNIPTLRDVAMFLESQDVSNHPLLNRIQR